MQLQQFPVKIHKDVDKLVRRYVWGKMDSSKKMYLLSWETLCRPKHLRGGAEEGGLVEQGPFGKACMEGSHARCSIVVSGPSGQILWQVGEQCCTDGQAACFENLEMSVVGV